MRRCRFKRLWKNAVGCSAVKKSPVKRSGKGRRGFSLFLITGAAIQISASEALASETPLRTADFLESVGVNTHTIYTDSQYVNINQTIKAVKYLGLTLVRESAPFAGNQGQGTYINLIRSGLRLDLIVNGFPIPAAIDAMAVLERSYPGAVHAVEGMNEVNNWGAFTYAKQVDKHRAAVAYQADLYAAVKTDPALRRKPVFNLTDYPDEHGAADFGNFHSYPKTLIALASTLRADRKHQLAVMPGSPLVCTETGVSTIKGGTDEASQARAILVELFDNAAAGVRETYLYQLFDAYPDPTGEDSQKHFGLFDFSYSPKKAAFAIHNLTSLLFDSGSSAHAFTPTKRFKVEGGEPTSRVLSLQRSDGLTFVVIWNELASGTRAVRNSTAVRTQAMRVSIGHRAASAFVYDPITGAKEDFRDHSELLVKLDSEGGPRIAVFSSN